MEKLFDETNEFQSKFYRTVWYGYIKAPLNNQLIEKLCSVIKSDLEDSPEDKPYATHWVFYSEILSDDALGEKVRPSLMVREVSGKFSANYNMSDFDFVSTFDLINDFCHKLKTALTR